MLKCLLSKLTDGLWFILSLQVFSSIACLCQGLLSVDCQFTNGA